MILTNNNLHMQANTIYKQKNEFLRKFGVPTVEFIMD